MMSYHASTALHKITDALVLAVFLATVFFGFATMMYEHGGDMQSDCLFSVMGASLCPQNIIAGAIHHISEYQSFLATLAGSGAMALLLAFLIILYPALRFAEGLPLYRPPVSRTYSYRFSTRPSIDRKIVRWLSLFENSPATA